MYAVAGRLSRALPHRDFIAVDTIHAGRFRFGLRFHVGTGDCDGHGVGHPGARRNGNGERTCSRLP